ncbi:MAG: hypothetical protein ACKVH8_17300 [Pirellulales bacterium]
MGEHDFSDQSKSSSNAGGGDFAPDPTNPYASPETGYQPQDSPSQPGQINPQQADLGSIINYSFECWKEHLGILVGAGVVVIGITYAIAFPLGFVQAALKQNSPELGVVVSIGGQLLLNIIQIFLGIGQAKIALKVARKESVEFSELFSGGPQFLPVFGASILFGLAVVLGFLLLIIPGVLLLLFFWPFYFLVVDEKRRVMESFSTAYEIGSINAGNTFIIWLLSLGIMLLGVIACCIGVIFAAPLVTMLWATAYLQMTGQIQAR